MIRAVIDTNVFISSFITYGKSRKVLDKVFAGKIRLLTSPAILLEFEEVLSREKFGLTRTQVQRIVSLLIHSSEVIESKTKIILITEDPDDNKLLECAIDGRAKYIITGDKHLLKIRKYKNIRIVNPNSFLRKR
ncbi:MAG: putative toxin-antitoxin system toxin component, PIN family [Candidatus Thermoplasmatota archaeon]|nr:putative toxin-antitoxin system toxin component, PIN family [Candidatus Thermoplasmatota archaeon]